MQPQPSPPEPAAPQPPAPPSPPDKAAQVGPDGKLDFTTKGRRYEKRFKWPRDAHQLKDDDGNLLFECELDASGEPQLDDFGRAKIRLDAKGERIPLMSQQPDPATQVEVVIQYYKPSRRMRQEAINAAIASSMQARKRRAFDFAAFERLLINRMLIWTNLKDIPGPGWDDLDDPDLGDYIIEITELWKSIGGKEAMEMGKALPPGAHSASGGPTTSTMKSS